LNNFSYLKEFDKEEIAKIKNMLQINIIRLNKLAIESKEHDT
tara:strand:+ start:509 stop:634 length:126 start_codon:yes stop_codon:yes gene_type:complete